MNRNTVKTCLSDSIWGAVLVFKLASGRIAVLSRTIKLMQVIEDLKGRD
jgi:hypothetical protein